MNSILEALRKSAPGTPGQNTPSADSKDFLFGKSPYDSASVYWERRRMKDENGLRRTIRWALALTGLSVILTLSFAAYIFFGLHRGSSDASLMPARAAQTANVANPANSATISAKPAAPAPVVPVAVANVPLPPQYAPSVAGLPKPFEESAATAQSQPVMLPAQPEVAPIAPNATPLPLDMRQTPQMPAAPLLPPGASTGTSADFSLQAIIWDKQNPMAMINKQTVHVGDQIGGATVLAINPNTVVLQAGGNRIELKS